MSKALFQKYREDEIHTMCTMPYELYKHLKTEDINLMKHYYPDDRSYFKTNKKWVDLNNEINEKKILLKDLEYKIKHG